MKFTCDSCGAQYMISDEKVGPNGVKVRCKRCGNVILVRRVTDTDESLAAPAPGSNGGDGAAAPGNGLDDELGQAFDAAFGDPPPAELGQPEPMGEEDAPLGAAPDASSPADTEWYVAIGQAQVGPLPLGEVKRKWEGGDIGPDSLVWRPGLADWQPLTAVSELAGYLAPVARAASHVRREAQPRIEPQPAREKVSEAPSPAAREDATWKPVGASALAALASEEIAARAPSEPRPAPVAAPSSLVDALPDGGGVDPTGSLPLTIKALETSASEAKAERRSSVASRAEETRHKRSVARVVAVGVVLVIAIVGAAAAYVVLQMRKLGASPPGAVATAPAPASAQPPPASAPPPAAATPSVAAVAPAAPAPPAAAPGAAPHPAQAAVAERAVPPPAAPPPTPVEKSRPAAPPPRAAKAEPPPRVAKAEPPARVAKAEPPPARAAPAHPPAAAPPRKKDSLLDFDSSDSSLDEALGGSGSGRSVYVPPAPRGGSGRAPGRLTPAEINESVAARIDALRKCVSDQKQRDPSASGVLKLRWVISGDGSVREVKTLTGEYASSPFAQCITGVVKTIRFPRSGTSGQEVTFPFSF